MKYPKVGEKFYWMDNEGVVHEETCFKIEKEDNPDLETMYFTYISPNGGGAFITESDILDTNSKEVQDFIKTKNNVKFDVLKQLGYSDEEAIKILNAFENEN